MRKLCVVLWVLSIPVQASPFLTADPYPATATQPDTFQVFLDGATTPAVSNAVLCDAAAVAAGICPAADGSKIMRHDLAALVKGAHTATAKACNIPGCSVMSNQVSFSNAAPAAPGNFKLVP